MRIEVEIPEGASLGDMVTARGAIFNAATAFIDWEKFGRDEPDAIAPAGRLLLSLGAEIKKAENG